MEMQGANEQMMGELFQGPWLTSETFDLAKEWGITPQIQDIIHDLDMQIAQFKERRRMIDTLMKRGLPKGFLDELKQMTPEEAMPILAELISATPKETQKLVKKLNIRERVIKDATKLDFTREITAFRKAGMNMGEALINGFGDAGVGKWFDGWIKATFPNLINTAVATAVAEWKKEHPKPKETDKKKDGKNVTKRKEAPSNNNNSKTVTVNNHFHGPVDAHDRMAEDRARKAAFVMKNAARSAIR